MSMATLTWNDVAPGLSFSVTHVSWPTDRAALDYFARKCGFSLEGDDTWVGGGLAGAEELAGVLHANGWLISHRGSVSPSVAAVTETLMEQAEEMEWEETARLQSEIKSERAARRLAHDLRMHGRRLAPAYDHDNPTTVEDFLWSWSDGRISGVEAQRLLDCDLDGLHRLAAQHDVPHPQKAGGAG